MEIINGKEWTFDTVAKEYAELRPGYPAELYIIVGSMKQVKLSR